MRILALCGSLRSGSFNAAALRSAAEFCARRAWQFDLAAGLDTLPFFNQDLEENALPEAPGRLRASVGAADGLLIATPEYAHGTSGLLKNALEWLVGGGEIARKPVALMSASPAVTGGNRAQAWLRETLTVMGADVLDQGLEIPMATLKIADGRVTDPQTLEAIGVLLETLVEHSSPEEFSAGQWLGRRASAI